MMEEIQVAIVWASQKRHIAVNRQLLCQKSHKSKAGGYINGHYCSYSLDPTVFERKKSENDVDYPSGGGHHTDGIIPFVELSNAGIIESSVCEKCKKEYNKLLIKTKQI